MSAVSSSTCILVAVISPATVRFPLTVVSPAIVSTSILSVTIPSSSTTTTKRVLSSLIPWLWNAVIFPPWITSPLKLLLFITGVGASALDNWNIASPRSVKP